MEKLVEEASHRGGETFSGGEGAEPGTIIPPDCPMFHFCFGTLKNTNTKP